MIDKIGYGKPPKVHQFKKGQSGNPKGRPKKRPLSVANIIAGVVNGPASYLDGAQKRVATRNEVGLRVLIKQALTGSVRAAEEILILLQQSEKARSDVSLKFSVIGWLPEYPGQTAEEKRREEGRESI